MADDGDLKPTDEPEEALTKPTDEPEEALTVIRSDSKVPRWVIKAITLFWLGWAVTYIGTGMLRNLRSFLIIVLIPPAPRSPRLRAGVESGGMKKPETPLWDSRLF